MIRINMKLLLVDNVHLCRDDEGKYYAPSIYNYKFLQRYLNVFDEVRFMGKIKPVDYIDIERCAVVSGKNVEIYEIPWYQGIREMVSKAEKIFPVYKDASKGCDCIIFRIAQIESFMVYLLGGRKLPYAVEVVNDPEAWVDMLPLIRKFSVLMMRQMIKNAKGSAFVTEEILQKKYAIRKKKAGSFTTNYSSVELDKKIIAKEPMIFPKNEEFRIVHVSNLINNDMKGHKTLIDAAKIIAEHGYSFKIAFIGEGDKINDFKSYAYKIGVADKIQFIGRINKINDLFAELKDSSLMVFPSVTEGLPRTVIEAMAVGLPVLSTFVGGIPELLDNKYLFRPEDDIGFANKIMQLMDNPEELQNMSKANILRAQSFTVQRLSVKRNWFYKKLKESIDNSFVK